jgi:MscS family membrane protein
MIRKLQRLCVLVSLGSAFTLPDLAQIPASIATAPQPSSPAPATDTLNRSNPRDTVHNFLAACQRGDYLRASEYLDLRQLPANDRRREGMELALELEEVLNRDPHFDLDKLSDAGEGARNDRLPSDRELVDSFVVNGRRIDVQLQRVPVSPGLNVWLFSAESVRQIPSLRTLLGESEFEKHLPEVLVKTSFLDTALWRWIVLILLAPALAILARLISRLGLQITRRVMRKRVFNAESYRLQTLLGPVGLLLGVLAYGAGVALVGPSALVRFYISRILIFLSFMAIAWIAARLIEIFSRRLHFSADIRQQALFSSVIPLTQRVIKIVIFVVALVATISAWGYNTSTIWATLGVGSLAIALAAQKTLENFFGGVSVIFDRPVLVGDFCRVGDKTGTVEDIGLRSTKIRTLDRTLVTVPNSQFSTMTLENFAAREKMWFHHTVSLRCDSTPAQIKQVMTAFERILKDHPNVEIGGYPVRLTGIGDYSYNIELFAYVLTANGDEYMIAQSEILLKIIGAVEEAGTGLAVPLRELTGTKASGELLGAASAVGRDRPPTSDNNGSPR